MQELATFYPLYSFLSHGHVKTRPISAFPVWIACPIRRASVCRAARRPLTLAERNAPPEVDPACPARLRQLEGVRIALADPFERTAGCVVEGAVLVRELAGIRLRPDGALMRCEVAEALHKWLEQEVKPEAQTHLQSPIKRVHHIGTYNCRHIAGSRTLSQHSFANAVDITAFRLEDGRKLTLLKGWNAEDEAVRHFWQRIHRRSCRHFSVSLAPTIIKPMKTTSILILAPCVRAARERPGEMYGKHGLSHNYSDSH